MCLIYYLVIKEDSYGRLSDKSRLLNIRYSIYVIEYIYYYMFSYIYMCIYLYIFIYNYYKKQLTLNSLKKN